jgi:O-antigen biosynthesis protein
VSGVTKTESTVEKLDREEQLRAPSESECAQLVHCLHRAAFGCFASPEGLARYVGWLRSGSSLQAVAEDIVRSVEFQNQHGSGQTVDREFLTALYHNGLGREPDPQGLASWVSAAEKGATPAIVLAAFARSDESLKRHRTVLIQSLYRTAFGQCADYHSLQTSLDALQSRASIESLSENLVHSPEFQARHGSSSAVDAAFLITLYRDGLGRDPDSEGFAQWLEAGQNGASRACVLSVFASSAEALEKAVRHPGQNSDLALQRLDRKEQSRAPSESECAQLVHCLYRAAFGTFATPEGLARYVGWLHSGSSFQAVAKDIVRSAAFQQRHGSEQAVDHEFITALYRNGLGREPDPQGLASWVSAAEKGATRAIVLAAFASSDESLKMHRTVLVQSLYRTAFGRWPGNERLATSLDALQSGISIEILSENFVRSPEFQSRYGSGSSVDAAFLTALYRDGLGREPDPEGFARWLEAGLKGASRACVLSALAGSIGALERASSGLAELVHSLYKTAFGHMADPAGQANGIHWLKSDGSAEALARQLVNSTEFLARHGFGQEIDAKYITALFNNGLERRPDFESLAFWLAKPGRGATRADVLAAVATSAEALEKLGARDLGPDALYRRWVAENDTISEIDRALIRRHIAALPFRPLISVVIISGRASEGVLRQSVVSVAEQLYPYWELIIAVDGVSEQLSNKVLLSSATDDLRIRIAQFDGPQAAAANAAIETATGDFVMLMETGDLLPEHALYELAIEICRNPSADVVYGDCDEIAANGERRNPWFKPGWDPDLLLGQDYINVPVVYRLALVEQIGFLRPEFEGAELYDLALRATAQTAPDRVRHVPAILYRRRIAEANQEDPARVLRCRKMRERAVREHLDRRGYTHSIIRPAPQMPGGFHIVWPLPAKAPLVSVIVPTRDRADLLAECAEGVLRRTDYSNLEFLIVDNESIEERTHELFERLCREDKRVRILSMPGPFKYAKLNNQAAKEANGEVLLLLNNDIAVIDSDWLRELVSQANRPDVGMVGAKLLYPNGKVQHGGMVTGPGENFAHIHRLADRNDPGYFGQLALARTLQAVTAACAAIRRSVFFEAGGLNETDLEVAFNDVDLCLRLGDLGYRVVWTPFAELFHLESASRGYEDTPEKQERFRRELLYVMKTFASLLEAGDPFHNPNLLFGWNESKIPAPSRRERPWHYVVEHVSDLHRHFSRTVERLHESKHP